MNEWPDLYHYRLGFYETCLMVWSETHREVVNDIKGEHTELRLTLRRLMEKINE